MKRFSSLFVAFFIVCLMLLHFATLSAANLQFEAQANNSRQVTLKLFGASGVSIDVFRDDKLIGNSENSSYVDKTVEAGKKYKYKVKISSGNNIGYATEEITVLVPMNDINGKLVVKVPRALGVTSAQ